MGLHYAFKNVCGLAEPELSRYQKALSEKMAILTSLIIVGHICVVY